VKPVVLLTNDDGCHAAGLLALREALAAIARVVTVAPASEMSGVSHAITLSRQLTVEDLDVDLHSVDGTPTDCVNVAIHHVLGEVPAVVVSGCNHGANLGDDVAYSGTVGAAKEGASLGLPAIAVSQARANPHSDFRAAADLTVSLVAALLRGEVRLQRGTFLNLNLPEGEVKGVSLTRLARRTYRDSVKMVAEETGRRFVWVGGRPEWESMPGTDHHAVIALRHASLSLLGSDLSLAVPPGSPDVLPLCAAMSATLSSRRGPS
jgi:5'-nucleotidase